MLTNNSSCRGCRMSRCASPVFSNFPSRLACYFQVWNSLTSKGVISKWHEVQVTGMLMVKRGSDSPWLPNAIVQQYGQASCWVYLGFCSCPLIAVKHRPLLFKESKERRKHSSVRRHLLQTPRSNTICTSFLSRKHCQFAKI